MKKEALDMARAAYAIESECIAKMLDYLDEDAFAAAVELLKNAPRIGTCGCGHSGIICQHFAHLLCCIEQPARFISPAEAVHGATGFLTEGDVMVFASRAFSAKRTILGKSDLSRLTHRASLPARSAADAAIFLKPELRYREK